MRYSQILYTVSQGVASVTLNRPDRLNAYTVEMGEELVDAFRAAREDAAVRVVVLTGAGRGFCAGVDLEHLMARTADGTASTPKAGPKLGEEDFVRKLPLELLEYPKPTIAAINGHAIGVGVTMVLPFDVRIAAEDAKLGLTFAKLGMLPGLGSTHLLSRLVGVGKARELVLTARVIRGVEAAQIGLVERAVPGEDLMRTVAEMAGLMASFDPDVLRLAKRALRDGAMGTMEEALRSEQALSAELRGLRSQRAG